MTLNTETLMRAGAAYTRGYRDGESGKPCLSPEFELHRPFDSSDYSRGWAAGVNDAMWEKYYSLNGYTGNCWAVQRWTTVQRHIYITTPQVRNPTTTS